MNFLLPTIIAAFRANAAFSNYKGSFYEKRTAEVGNPGTGSPATECSVKFEWKMRRVNTQGG
jgi:hypothetical protein